MSWLWLLLPLVPGLFIVLHTLIGLLLMIPYGVEDMRWNKGALEVIAKRRKDGRTRIWFEPGAQTWGLVIFHARDWYWDHAPLKVHERVHILQSILFGVVYPVTYLLSFGLLYLLVKLGWDWWDRDPYDDDVWHAYRMIPWEIWAYAKQHRFEGGEIPDAWGA